MLLCSLVGSLPFCLISSNPGKTFKSAGWDFSIGGSNSTGTVRTAAKPPQIRERKLEASYNQARPRTPESGNALSESREASFGKDTSESYHSEHQDNDHDVRFSFSFCPTHTHTHKQREAIPTLHCIIAFDIISFSLLFYALNKRMCFME